MRECGDASVGDVSLLVDVEPVETSCQADDGASDAQLAVLLLGERHVTRHTVAIQTDNRASYNLELR